MEDHNQEAHPTCSKRTTIGPCGLNTPRALISGWFSKPGLIPSLSDPLSPSPLSTPNPQSSPRSQYTDEGDVIAHDWARDTRRDKTIRAEHTHLFILLSLLALPLPPSRHLFAPFQPFRLGEYQFLCAGALCRVRQPRSRLRISAISFDGTADRAEIIFTLVSGQTYIERHGPCIRVLRHRGQIKQGPHTSYPPAPCSPHADFDT